MQNVYNGYLKLNRGENNGRRDTFTRSAKRSPYGNTEYELREEVQERKPLNLYPFFTFAFLFICYPIGVIMLCSRKIKLDIGKKLLITFIMALVCCFMLVFIANCNTNNTTMKSVQTKLIKTGTWINEKTGGFFDSIGNGISNVYNTGVNNALSIWDSVDESVARAYLSCYSKVGDNISAIKHTLPTVLLSNYKTVIGYKEPVPTPEPRSQALVNGTRTPQPTVAPTVNVTPTPVPTPAPTPEPTPIAKPQIQNVSTAPVWYTEKGKWYHVDKTCQNMYGASSHYLSEAKAANKGVCPVCGSAVPYELMERDGDYLWLDSAKLVHTTHDCTYFTGSYTVVPFEDVYNGRYTYCDKCNANTAYEYMRQNDKTYNIITEETVDNADALYEYEKSFTVYYDQNNGRYYHADPECGQFKDDKFQHSLYDALHVDKRQRCGLCLPATEEDALNSLNMG